MGGNYSCPNSQNDALIIPWPASESAWKSCALGRMLNHFLTRDLDHESYTHEKKGRGKDEQQITKWKEHLQPEKNTARMEHNKTESDLSDQKKNIELPCSSWRSPLSLCHSSRSAGRRQQEGSATPPPPPPSRDPCSRRPEIRDPILNRGGASNRDPRISDQISHGQGPTNQPSRRPTATSRAKIGFSFSGGGITNPATSGSSKNNPRISPARSAAAGAAALVLSL